MGLGVRRSGVLVRGWGGKRGDLMFVGDDGGVLRDYGSGAEEVLSSEHAASLGDGGFLDVQLVDILLNVVVVGLAYVLVVGAVVVDMVCCFRLAALAVAIMIVVNVFEAVAEADTTGSDGPGPFTVESVLDEVDVLSRFGLAGFGVGVVLVCVRGLRGICIWSRSGEHVDDAL